MSIKDYYQSLDQAINNYFDSENPSYDRLGKGSFFSWKVEVLLFKEGKGWKFEKANFFQRIAWKIAKYLPCFYQFYNTVSLNRIKFRINEMKDPSDKIIKLKKYLGHILEKSSTSIEKSENQKDSRSELRILAEKLGYSWLLTSKPSTDYLFYPNDGEKQFSSTHRVVSVKLLNKHGQGDGAIHAVGMKKGYTNPESMIGNLASIEGICPNSQIDVLYFDKDTSTIKVYNGYIAQQQNRFICYGEFKNIEEVLALKKNLNSHFLFTFLDIQEGLEKTGSFDPIPLKHTSDDENKKFLEEIKPQLLSLVKKREDFFEAQSPITCIMEISKQFMISEAQEIARLKKQVDQFLKAYFEKHHLSEEKQVIAD